MRRAIGLLLLCMTLSPSLMALDANSLYSSTIVVNSQDGDERKQALTQALQEVLIKASGDSAVATSAALADKVVNPENYLQGYSYEEISTTDTPSDSQPSLELKARFNSQAIKTLLAKAGETVWKDNHRPVVLVWLVFENEAGKQLVTGDSGTNFSVLLSNQSLRRGIPFVLPQMDLEDLKNVSLQDVWNVNISILQNEATRYHADAMLVGRVNQANGSWQGLWTLLVGTQRKEWVTRGLTDSKMIAPAIDAIADVLYKQSSAAAEASTINESTAQGNTLLLIVNNVKSVTDYTKVLDYLQSIPIISQVDALHVLPKQIVFSLTLRDKPEALQKILNSGHSLRPVKATKLVSNSTTGLSYQWVR